MHCRSKIEILMGGNVSLERQEDKRKLILNILFIVYLHSCADFTGLHCVVSNSLGEGSPCPAEVVLEVELSRLQQQELVIILVICGVTLTLLLLLALATCYYCSRRHKQPDKGEQTSYHIID